MYLVHTTRRYVRFLSPFGRSSRSLRGEVVKSGEKRSKSKEQGTGNNIRNPNPTKIPIRRFQRFNFLSSVHLIINLSPLDITLRNVQNIENNKKNAKIQNKMKKDKTNKSMKSIRKENRKN